MPKKMDFMGRSKQEEYDLAEGQLNAPVAQERAARQRKMKQSIQSIEEQQKARKQKMDESIQSIQDDIRYQGDLEFREAMRNAREREYKKRGF